MDKLEKNEKLKNFFSFLEKNRIFFFLSISMMTYTLMVKHIDKNFDSLITIFCQSENWLLPTKYKRIYDILSTRRFISSFEKS
jgi:hypothetical protein